MSKLIRQWANSDTDLFGKPLSQPPDVKSASPAQNAMGTDGNKDIDLADFDEQITGITQEDIESFKTLECEVRFRTKEHGDIYLVPKHTDKDRLEITPEDVRSIQLVVDTFDAKIVSFRRLDDRKPQKITCEHYYPQADDKHCVFYLEDGACSRGDEFMCVEWLKANQKKGAPK